MKTLPAHTIRDARGNLLPTQTLREELLQLRLGDLVASTPDVLLEAQVYPATWCSSPSRTYCGTSPIVLWISWPQSGQCCPVVVRDPETDALRVVVQG